MMGLEAKMLDECLPGPRHNEVPWLFTGHRCTTAAGLGFYGLGFRIEGLKFGV